MSTTTHRAPGAGWLRFAGTMLLLGAVANALYGIAGLANDDHFVPDALLFGAVSFWGGINAVAQMMAIGAYPIWSTTVLAIDGLIIYGLAVYGFRAPA